MLHGNEIWGGAAFIGIAAAAWGRLRMLLSRVVSFAIVTIAVESEAARAVQAMCWTKYRRSPFGSRNYSSSMEHVRPVRRWQNVGYEKIGTDPIVFWNGWKPLLMGANSKNQESPGMQPGPSTDKFTLTFIRGTWDADSLVKSSLDGFNEKTKATSLNSVCKRFSITRFSGRLNRSGSDGATGVGVPPGTPAADLSSGQYRILGWREDELGPLSESNQSALDAMALPASVLEAVEEVRRWKESEEWYRTRQIPWTRGALLYGKPGTGKTSLVRAIAQDFDMPVFIFDLASLSNQEMTERWEFMQGAVPCIALMEDIDSVFKGRENRLGESSGGLSFDCLLNCLSGIESANGVYKIATTNNVDDLDPALGVPSGQSKISTRPGRLDRAIELPSLDESGRRKIAERILADCPRHIERLVREGASDTGAQFTERCAVLALAEMWNDAPIPMPQAEHPRMEESQCKMAVL